MINALCEYGESSTNVAVHICRLNYQATEANPNANKWSEHTSTYSDATRMQQYPSDTRTRCIQMQGPQQSQNDQACNEAQK